MTSSSEKRFLKAYDAHADEIYRHCYFRVFSRGRAEEFVQEAFLRTWQYLEDGHEVENIRAFLYRTATNIIIDDVRRKKESSLDAILEEAPNLEPGDDGREGIERELAGKEIMAVLATLSDDVREILTMRYVDDLDIAEIAEILNITPNNVSVRLNRAMKTLKEATNP